MNSPASALGVSGPVVSRARDEFPRSMVELAFAAGAGVALVGALARWVLGVELGFGASALAAAASAILSVLTGFTSTRQ